MEDRPPFQLEQVQIVSIAKTAVWIENDLFGGRHVVVQHEGHEPFTYCSFFYDYAYTSNSITLDAAERMAVSLGATKPVEHRLRSLPEIPAKEQIKAQIEALQSLLDAQQGGAA